MIYIDAFNNKFIFIEYRKCIILIVIMDGEVRMFYGIMTSSISVFGV